MDTRRFGRFTFRVGAEGTGLACAFQRVMDAHARFVASPLSRVGNPLECEVVASSIFGTNTIEGGMLSEEETQLALDLAPEAVQDEEQRRVRNMKVAYDRARQAARRPD